MSHMSLVYCVTKKLSSLIAIFKNLLLLVLLYVTLLVIRTLSTFSCFSFFPVYDYEKRVMNDKYVRVYRYFLKRSNYCEENKSAYLSAVTSCNRFMYFMYRFNVPVSIFLHCVLLNRH